MEEPVGSALDGCRRLMLCNPEVKRRVELHNQSKYCTGNDK